MKTSLKPNLERTDLLFASRVHHQKRTARRTSVLSPILKHLNKGTLAFAMLVGLVILSSPLLRFNLFLRKARTPKQESQLLSRRQRLRLLSTTSVSIQTQWRYQSAEQWPGLTTTTSHRLCPALAINSKSRLYWRLVRAFPIPSPQGESTLTSILSTPGWQGKSLSS